MQGVGCAMGEREIERRRTIRIRRSALLGAKLEGLDRPSIKIAETLDEWQQAFGVVYRRAPQYRDVARLWSDAKSHYEPLVNMPEELSRLYGKGISEFLKGNYPKAIEIWRKVLEKSPNHFIVQRNIAEAQARLKEARPAAKEPQP